MAILDVTNQTKVRVIPAVAASAGINSVETVLGGATNAIPPNFLKIGQNLRVTLIGTCTSTAANVSTFALRVGTLGTVADAVALTAATGVAATSGTAVPFRAVYDFTVRTIGATGTLAGSLTLLNGGASTAGVNTGIIVQAVSIVPFTASTIDTTATNFFMPTYAAAAATTTCTFQNVIVELV